MTANVDIVSKLLDRVAISDTGCWEFIGGRTGDRYGVISFGRGRQRGAHVISYEYYVGPIPKGAFVCHSCDNPPCCNPKHLFLGSHQTNKDDEIAKDRHVYGERVGNHKLSQDDVREIRFLIAKGYSLAFIGRKFDVTRQAIFYIKSGKNWSYLP